MKKFVVSLLILVAATGMTAFTQGDEMPWNNQKKNPIVSAQLMLDGVIYPSGPGIKRHEGRDKLPSLWGLSGAVQASIRFGDAVEVSLGPKFRYLGGGFHSTREVQKSLPYGKSAWVTGIAFSIRGADSRYGFGDQLAAHFSYLWEAGQPMNNLRTIEFGVSFFTRYSEIVEPYLAFSTVQRMGDQDVRKYKYPRESIGFSLGAILHLHKVKRWIYTPVVVDYF